MSQREWRRVAEGLLPEVRSRQLADLLFSLVGRLRHGSPSPDLMARAFAFAGYCLHPDRHAAVREAIVQDFLRHLASDNALRPALAAYFAEDLHRLTPLLANALPDDELAAWSEAAAAAARPPRIDWSPADLEALHEHATANERRLAASVGCGCFYCLAEFAPTEIVEWIPEVDGQQTPSGRTALCPRCGIDAVLPSDIPRTPVTAALLAAMQAYWFGAEAPSPPVV